MNNGVENEGMRCIKKAIENFATQEKLPVTYDVYNVRQKGEVPSLLYDGYISSGGPETLTP